MASKVPKLNELKTGDSVVDNVSKLLASSVQDPLQRELNNKENQQSNQQDEVFEKFLKESHGSTPNVNYSNRSRSETIGRNADTVKLMEMFEQKMNLMENKLNGRLDAIEKQIVSSENELKFSMDQYYHWNHTGSFKLFKMTEREIDALKEGMGVILRTDMFAQEFYRLKAENEELKRKLHKS